MYYYFTNIITAMVSVLSGLGIIPQRERSPVQFPVRAHAWVAGLVPGQGCVREATD